MKSKVFSLFLALLYISAVTAAEVGARLMPAAFQGNVFHIAEGTPAVLNLKAWRADKKMPYRGILTVELPPEIELAGTAFIFNRSDKGINQDKISKKEIIRDGRKYIRYETALSPHFLSSTTRMWSWEYNSVFLTAAPGTAGKEFTMYFKVMLNKDSSDETAVKLKLLPPLKKPARKTVHFAFDQHSVFSTYTAPEALREKLTGIWRGLTAKPVGFGVRPAYPDSMKPVEGYEGFWTLSTMGTVPAFDYEGYGCMKPYPEIKGGTPSPAYLAEDPEKKLENYVRRSIRRYRKAMPHIRRLFWNIEPTQDRFGQYDLEVFARKMKLAKVPQAAEVIHRYPDKWRKFRVDSTMKTVRKVTDVMKQEFPELKIELCGVPLEKRYPGGFNPNSAIDLRIADKLPGVDVHLPMQYYSGVNLFDDVEFTLKKIRKPLAGLQDINEGSQQWYNRYTAPQILQNAVLYAVLGASGYHSYPRDNYDHRYIQAIYDAYGMIACAENIWKKGKDITGKCKVDVVSAVPVKFQSADGKWNTAALNSGAELLRSRIHRLGGETAVTLFNFDAKRAVFVKVAVPGTAPEAPVSLAPDTALVTGGRTVTGRDLASGLLLKVPENGVLVLTAGCRYTPEKTLDISGYSSELNRLLAELRKEASGKYTAQRSGICASDWAPLDGKFHLRLIAEADRKVWIDTDSASVISWQNPMRWGKPYIVRWTADCLRTSKRQGFAGAIEFISSTGRRKINGFKLGHVKTEPFYNEAVFTAQIPRYQGIEQWNDPLEGLKFTVKYLQNDTGFNLVQKITLKNLNPRKETVKGVLFVRNFVMLNKAQLLADTHSGRKFFADGSAGVLKNDAKVPLAAKMTEYTGWKGGNTTLIVPPHGKTRGYFSCVPDAACSGVFTWSDFNGGRTAEFFTPEFELAPGEERTFTFLYGTGKAAVGDTDYQADKNTK